MKTLNAADRKSGFQIRCPGDLSRRTEMLIVAGFGRSKRIWALDSVNVKHTDLVSQQEREYSPVRSGTLFVLAGTILYMGCRSILVRAIAYLRVR